MTERTCQLPGCARPLPVDSFGWPLYVNEYEQGRYGHAVCAEHWNAPNTGAAAQASAYLADEPNR